ncbi:conserved protein of unknown function [Methanocaldococcus lauensis]|uniref:Sjogrens syndrome scleroderma autoantigen 1 n=1 Tax=Methanocaldococcus lauensis TaxID=2546128 RepID=A0A8D6PYM1_9EURY|nr:Sjogren's syndrome/scleroderma autoantigen 1 family protein [Methanocaldococcus lauensis]CAB3289764.1 conserved protein of unknown function [Methanocaldococcus lauensis]
MEEDEFIKILSNELLKGSKMLSKHCQKCGYPLFEKNGKIYCPVCERIKEEEIKTKDKEKELTTQKDKEDKKVDVNIEEIIKEKINYLGERLKNENEINRIKEIGEALYILIKIFKKIK